ncbi:MAG: transforming acidic coiled-coil-containing protein [Pseudomonadales bacterium]|nr:transforming acidic coiled-coil-containing protein [Pseudomonadales bacterium]
MYPKPLTDADVCEFIFDNLKMDIDDCIGLDLRTGRRDTKEIMLKGTTNPERYTFSGTFKDHEITVSKLLTNVTKVTFHHVPLFVPDEEILHLCGVYGEVQDNKVLTENVKLQTGNLNINIPGSTRYVYMTFNRGMSMHNYYWIEGPLQQDPGRRIFVNHRNQEQQCSNCLQTADSGCPGGGAWSACKAAGFPRTRMSTYMATVKEETGYEQLKFKYQRKNEANMDDYVGDDGIEDHTVPITPAQEISDLQAKLKEEQAKLKDATENLEKKDKELEDKDAKIAETVAFSTRSTRRLSVTRKGNEKKVISLINKGTNWTEDSCHMAVSIAASLDDNAYGYNDNTNTLIEKVGAKNFWIRVEKAVDDEMITRDRLKQMKELVEVQAILVLKNVSKRAGDTLHGPPSKNGKNGGDK